MKKILFLILLFMFSQPILAADWHIVENTIYMYDKDTISRTKDTVRAWVIADEKGKFNGKKYVYWKLYKEVNCIKKTSSTLYASTYNKKGKLITSVDFEYEDSVKVTRIVPNTIGETLFNELCSY